MTKKISILYTFSDPSGLYGGWDVTSASIESITRYYKRLVLLNAVIPANKLLAYMERIDMETAKEIVEIFRKEDREILSFIGHQSTAELLSQKLGIKVEVNRGMYKPKPRDLALIFRLKKRLARPEDIKDVKEEDIEVWMVQYA